VDGDRSIAAVFQDILRNVQEIVRSEVRLAKAEVRDEASKALSSTVWLVGGAVAAQLALLFLLWTITYALALVMPMWGAALVVSGVVAAVAAVLLKIGFRRFALVHAEPERTVATIKENVAWVRQSSK
jgi:hypothetical protein